MGHHVPELIRRKREGGALTSEEIEFLIQGAIKGEIPDYQVSAFLMAVYFRGMEPDEAAAMARVMRDSGRKFDLHDLPGRKTDKHSTGGVGDKVSLILAPLVASAGIIDPMMAGRGLGHTGGTLDKLDSIPGYRWALGEEEFKAQLRDIGCAIIGQTEDFVPADRQLYALRDVTATVESIPLICASILSKKAASGVEALIMDVKCGSGAFMATEKAASDLAVQLIRIGRELNMDVSVLITQMSQPLGATIGNALEIHETLDLLEGGGPADTRALTCELGAEMLLQAGLAKEREVALDRLGKLLDDGTALAKFEKMVAAQGGDARVVKDRSILPEAPDREEFTANADGVIESMETRLIGVASCLLGAGRLKKDDEIDYAVGFEVHRKVGEKVTAGEKIITIHHRNGKGLDECKRMLREAIVVGSKKTEPLPLILKRLSPNDG